MNKPWSSRNQSSGLRRERLAPLLYVHPVRATSLIVTLVVAFLVEFGQPDWWISTPVVLVVIETYLLVITWLFSAIAVSTVEIVVTALQWLREKHRERELLTHVYALLPPGRDIRSA